MSADLAAFLEARWDETESAARAAFARSLISQRRGQSEFSGRWAQLVDDIVRPEDGMIVGPKFWPPAVRHVLLHDPARVLADIQAKRAILAHVSNWTHEDPDGGGYYSCPLVPGSTRADDEDWDGEECWCTLSERQTAILAPLAQIHADHEAFRPEWRSATM